MVVGFQRGELQLGDESVHLIDDQNRPDVLQPCLSEYSLGLPTEQKTNNASFDQVS